MKKFYKKSIVSILLVMILVFTFAAGCSKKDSSSDTSGETAQSGEETTGSAVVAEYGTEPVKVNPDEIALKVGDFEMTAAEMFYSYYSMKNTFEMYYGLTDWGQQLYEGYSYGDYLKSNIESQMLNLAYLMTKAEELGIELTEEEITEAKEEVASAFASLPDEDKETYGFTEDNLLKLNEHMKLANKVMEQLESDAAAALTDEEKASCKYRKIQHILISTMDGPSSTESGDTSESESGAETESPEESEYKAEQLQLAKEVLEKVKSGEDFEKLAEEYTADSGVEYSINADGQTPDGATMVTEFSEAANALGEGEISDIVETQYGYHIIKCVSLNDEDAAKEAEQNLAYTNITEAYQTWLESAEYTFSDTWKDYVIINPKVELESETNEETDGTAEETVADEAESEAESESAEESESTAESE